MKITRRLQKGDNTPGVDGGGRKVKKKSIYRNQWGDMASEGVGSARGKIRRSTRNRPDTRRRMQELMESRSGLGPHRWKGT